MSFAALLGQLDTDPRVRGRQFERICKWYLENAPQYQRLIRRVWLWDDWEPRWGSDAGIDLVAEVGGGELWAIQAKVYDPDYSLKKRDLDSFISESGRTWGGGQRFSQRLLIATTDHLGKTARETLAAQVPPVLLRLRSQIEAEEIEWPTSPERLVAPVREPWTPKPHQEEAIADVLAGFGSATRGQLVMACGTGKTLVGLWVAERLGARRPLVLVPSLSLMKQTLDSWLGNATEPFTYLAVCSDPTVAPAEHDEVVMSSGELGIPVTTDPVAIARFLSGSSSGRRVVFATYQSSASLTAAQALGVGPFDLVIADEAHRCAGPVAGEFAGVLDDERIRATRRLFMTATPKRFTGRIKREGKESDWEIASMDDEAQFGPVFHRLSFGEAIQRELLSDYRVVIVGVNNSTYRELAERGAFMTRDGRTITDARTLAAQIGLAKAVRKFDLRRLVSFHSRISRAHAFAAELPDLIAWLPDDERPDGTFRAEHVSGRMTAGERERRLSRLRDLNPGERALLANARCLGEGVDVPTLDGIGFMDPRSSQTDIVQAVGRAIRKAEDKTVGTVILPVFIEEHDDPHAALDSSPFRMIWDVLKALRAHDDALGAKLDTLRREQGRLRLVGDRPDKIHLDLPTGVGPEFARAFDARLVASTAANWEFWYGLLESFVATHGHARPIAAYRDPIDGRKLGTWVRTQRWDHRKGKLELDRAARLQALAGWSWDVHADRWDEGFSHLERFVASNGHARPSYADRDPEDGYRVGNWVATQRAGHRQGALERDRAARLEALPEWTWDTVGDAWDEGFRHLERFIAAHGHSRPPQRYSDPEDGYELGSWVANRRKARRTGKLEPDLVAELEALPGWTWNVLGDAWDEGFRHLERFVANEGHARPSHGFRDPDDEYRLGAWVGAQRREYKEGKLGSDRVTRLEALTGWTWGARRRRDASEESLGPFERSAATWGDRRDAWEESFGRLERYAATRGNARPERTYRDPEHGYRLGAWVVRQRTAYRQGKLEPTWAAQLEALPGWTWRSPGEAWENGLRHLERFVTSEGHAQPPGSYRDPEDGYRLGRWVGNQRAAYRHRELTPERVVRLQRLPGWAWEIRSGLWDDGLGHLERFIAVHGHAQPPTSYRDPEDGYRLGRWLSNQRAAHRRGTLERDRAGQLEALPGWTWDVLGDAWDEGFYHLERFLNVHGHARPPHGYHDPEDDFPLATWVETQRKGHKDGKLEPRRVAQLEGLTGWAWDALTNAWDKAFDHLEKFVYVHGHARPPQTYRDPEEGYPLGSWVSRQRVAHRKTRLAPDREARLEALPGWTWDATSGFPR